MWCHLPTSTGRIRSLRFIAVAFMIVALITTLFFASTSHAIPGTSKTVSFQGRLMTAAGAVVADGHYNIQFKIYQDGAGTSANDPGGTLKWTETYSNNGGTDGVEVKNGFFSVNLGSLNPFGTSVDWNQDTLFLSMNVAGSASGCTTFGTSPCAADGEMLPMKRITATPFAINSSQLEGIGASGFIQNSASPQTADFSISGTGTATTLQGNTSVIAPLFDSADTGTLDIGTVNASSINIATNNADHTINIGTGTGNQTVALGSSSGTSGTVIQGGTQGVIIKSSGGFVLHNNATNVDTLAFDNSGNVALNLNVHKQLTINDDQGAPLLIATNEGEILTGYGTNLGVRGAASFAKGITIQGSGALTYLTPNGYAMSTAINIENYTVPDYSSVLAFGLPSTSSATARGLLVADGRTSAHQATIGVLSPDENAIMGLSWNGSNSTGTLSNTADSLALQGNGLDLLTATNKSGQANVGIGNNASSGYALDVTGDTNTSTQYRINGSTALTDSALTFSGADTSNITSADGQALNLNGTSGVTIQTDGTTRATFSDTNIQIGSGTGNGEPTLLTLDKAATTPTASDGNALLGSMYYDTTLGKVQCYEADGWGECGASPDTFVTLSPEYANAVTHDAGTGTMTSDFCSDELNINNGSSSQPTICGTNETYNFYKWTSPEETAQTRSMFVTYQLPSNFKNFVAESTSLLGRTDDANADIAYQVYKNHSSGLTACGSSVSVSTGVQSTWQTAIATGSADPSTCDFAAGDSIVIRINLTSDSDANAYISNLGFIFSSH